ncbi:hypothetical protein [Streptomyces endophytica]|uniref:hypothetical protein n=1 Tax=Streptomyces endophytica TaxID=2991496 RepID=UPI00311AEE7E
MKSWLPGAHFAVLAHPEPQLVHLDRHATEAGLRPPGFATELAVARGQLTTDWVTGALAPAWQVQGAYEARLPAESARWWGTQKLIEFAAGIPDPAILRQLVASVRREECGWCGLEVLGDRCAFCTAPLARDRAPRGGGQAGCGPAAIAGPGAEAANAPRSAADQLPAGGPDPQALPAPGPDGEAPAARPRPRLPTPPPPLHPPRTPPRHRSPARRRPRPGPSGGWHRWRRRACPAAGDAGRIRWRARRPGRTGGGGCPRAGPPERRPRARSSGEPLRVGPPRPGEPVRDRRPVRRARPQPPPRPPDFAGEPDVPGASGVPGTPRTVARAR